MYFNNLKGIRDDKNDLFQLNMQGFNLKFKFDITFKRQIMVLIVNMNNSFGIKKASIMDAFLNLLWKFFQILNAFSFGKYAVLPNSSSIRNNWLYFAILSLREAEPVLICPVLSATAKSAIVLSSVSPER